MELKSLYIFIILIVILGILDFLWLGIFAKKFYMKEFGDSVKSPFNVYSAIVVYLLIAIGIFVLVLNNNFVKSPLTALLIGVIFGIVAYGIYDFTNFTVLKNYSLKLAIIDTLWGGVICGVSAFLTKYFSGFL
jgi:uncharacterized membrane protein